MTLTPQTYTPEPSPETKARAGSATKWTETLILDAIKGKSNALHAYDRMVWVIRTGFITLFFGGWGFVVKTLLEKQLPLTGAHMELIRALVIASIALAGAGLLIDLNYCLSRSYVVRSINTIVKEAKGFSTSGTLTETLIAELQIAGDRRGPHFEPVGFIRETLVALVIYVMPVVALLLGVDSVRN